MTVCSILKVQRVKDSVMMMMTSPSLLTDTHQATLEDAISIDEYKQAMLELEGTTY